ncbi:MAG: ABC transporter permease subunit [Proteobacteria bacterium]|nr:ABC transporter permease subunit [Pseudomonadota bacterium]
MIKTLVHKHHVFSHLALIAAILIVGAPVIFAFIISTQSPTEVFSYPPRLYPGSHYSNYQKAWGQVNLGRMMFNSAYCAIMVGLGKFFISVLAAFAFSHFRFKGRQVLFLLILITLMLPIPVRIVPLFEIVSDLKWVDTYWGLIVPFLASATGTFLFRQHFLTIPDELTDAAKIDGCGPIRFLFQILIPLSKNTIGAFAVIEFVYIWNQYLWPLIVINADHMKVVQVGIKMLISTEAMNNWGVIMAGVLIAMIPPLIVFFLMQRSFLKGFAFMREK